MLQAASALARSTLENGAGRRVLYVSGEEAIDQLRLRAIRLGVTAPSLSLATAIDVRDIAAAIEAERGAAMVVIDSIQTMWLEGLDSAPGSVAQVRASAFELIRLAKSQGFALILVGHVTKEGSLAGPRVLEHMVDAVLHFEGERGHQFRILRSAKNRFGATDEIGVFEMTGAGLAEVSNPSALFLAERRGHVSGSAVFAGMEGTRPVLLEVQALLSPAGGGAPRRALVGADPARLAMLVAVLEARCGLRLGQFDIHLNIAGGLRVSEPGGGPGDRGGAGVGECRQADGRRHGVLRRGRAVGRGAASVADGGAAEGGAEARLLAGGAAAAGGKGRSAGGGRPTGWAWTRWGICSISSRRSCGRDRRLDRLGAEGLVLGGRRSDMSRVSPTTAGP